MKNRKPHQIELPHLQEWMEKNESLFAQGGEKKLTVTMNGTLKVYFKNKVFWQTTQPFTAVEKYNELP